MSRLKVNVVKISIETEEGLFGTEIHLKEGLNVLSANNTKGKSSCLNSILYGLGIEELLGGTNTKSMKPVLKDVLKHQGKTLVVLESKVQLEISNQNGKAITLTRWIKSTSKDPRLIKVDDGPSLSEDKPFNSKDYYVHMKGSATEESGFHAYLAEFIGWELPKVPTFDGNDRLLYIQSLCPLFYIEQIKGWNSFYAPLPSNYGIRDLSKRATEFLLDLDVMKNTKEKDELKILKSIISSSWLSSVRSIREVASDINGVVSDLPEKPTLLIDFNIHLFNEKEELIEIDEKIIALENSLSKQSNYVRTISEIEDENEHKINEIETLVMTQQDSVNSLRREIQLESSNQVAMRENLMVLEDDLKKNQEAQKLYSLGAAFNSELSKGMCPTCHQDIEDTLLPQEITVRPLDLAENIRYIKEQINAIKFGLSQSEFIINNKKAQLSSIEEHLMQSRRTLRLVKSELREDPRLQTKQDIEKIVDTKIQIQKLREANNKLEKLKNDINSLQDDWKNYIARKENHSDEYFSKADKEKLKKFEQDFKLYLKEFGFSSVSIGDITISEDKYTPIVKGFDIKFDSSASDHIRLIWAYTCALANTAAQFNGHHPKLIIFDEPGQQQMDMSSQASLFKVLTSLIGQTIVASSLKQKEIEDLTADLKINIIDLGKDYIIKPIKK
ncbi:hypothetical protein BK139_23110 [Paenibacillus sp. FSL R5-0490]|uniref:hypothetical protein n=1 Tax=Bacillales TaxID=1385 RepID=UPI00096EEC48|nr:hypothetical protein [Paenibacillus sp. FSL R5-0490]OMF51771.1 hypothetical protein BK139_23110 [Paenibacillus sp. FSL R5-0490]